MQNNPPEFGSEHDKPKVNLSCLQCQRRKRKCDKNSPCQACTQAGITCSPISRARLPRGRHAAKRGNDDLRQRVARLEELLSSRGSVAGSAGLTPPEDGSSISQKDSSWSSIHEEVFGIRELVDRLAGDEPIDSSVQPVQADHAQRFDILLYGDTSCFVQPEILESPPPLTVYKLGEIYLHRVDQVFKVTHAPSLRALLASNALTPAQRALKFAVMFTAVNSVDDQECLELLEVDKTVFSGRLQTAVEVLLSRAELHTTTELVALQAFVIYLAGLRARNGCRAVCVLLATAVRIGQCLGLDVENRSYTPFESEMRRRIWCSIGILDLQASFDIGSYSALAGGATFKDVPLHINDADISPEDVTLPREATAFSDMTFCSATHDMLKYMRRMIHTPVDADGHPVVQQTWAQRNAIVEECAQVLQDKYAKLCSRDDAFQCFTNIVCDAMIVTLRLLVRRPMYRLYNAEPPPRDEFNVLRVATDVLDHTIQKANRPDFKPWEWFAWVKWYALAVLLAELCEFTEGEDVERAWVIAEISFTKLKTMIFDDILYRSMEKLFRKARSARSRKSGTAVNVNTSTTLQPSLHFKSSISAYGGAENFVSTFNDGDILSQPATVWDEMEMLSWPNWECFVQDLGDPTQFNTVDGYD